MASDSLANRVIKGLSDPFAMAAEVRAHYPPNMKRAPNGIAPSPAALDEGEINGKTESACQNDRCTKD
jgi:hypothetical protein